MNNRDNSPKTPPLAHAIFMHNYMGALHETLSSAFLAKTEREKKPTLLVTVASEINSVLTLAHIFPYNFKNGAPDYDAMDVEMDAFIKDQFLFLGDALAEETPEIAPQIITGTFEEPFYYHHIGATEPSAAVKALEVLASINGLQGLDDLPHNMSPSTPYLSHKDIMGSFAESAASKGKKVLDRWLRNMPVAIYQSPEAANFDAELTSTAKIKSLRFSFKRLQQLALSSSGEEARPSCFPDPETGGYPLGTEMRRDPYRGLFMTH